MEYSLATLMMNIVNDEKLHIFWMKTVRKMHS